MLYARCCAKLKLYLVIGAEHTHTMLQNKKKEYKSKNIKEKTSQKKKTKKKKQKTKNNKKKKKQNKKQITNQHRVKKGVDIFRFIGFPLRFAMWERV